jgi:hypothetical protein
MEANQWSFAQALAHVQRVRPHVNPGGVWHAAFCLAFALIS